MTLTDTDYQTIRSALSQFDEDTIQTVCVKLLTRTGEPIQDLTRYTRRMASRVRADDWRRAKPAPRFSDSIQPSQEYALVLSLLESSMPPHVAQLLAVQRPLTGREKSILSRWRKRAI